MPDVASSYEALFDFIAFLGIFIHYYCPFMSVLLYFHQTFTDFDTQSEFIYFSIKNIKSRIKSENILCSSGVYFRHIIFKSFVQKQQFRNDVLYYSNIFKDIYRIVFLYPDILVFGNTALCLNKITQKQTVFVFGDIYLHQAFTGCVNN